MTLACRPGAEAQESLSLVATGPWGDAEGVGVALICNFRRAFCSTDSPGTIAGTSACFLIPEHPRIAMNYLRCPHLDQLGRKLIEAYRRVSDEDICCFAHDINGAEPLVNIHRQMALHRSSCPICQQAESYSPRTATNVTVFHGGKRKALYPRRRRLSK
jgi:hypothetical protein